MGISVGVSVGLEVGTDVGVAVGATDGARVKRQLIILFGSGAKPSWQAHL